MNRENDYQFILVQRWMITKLGLKGNDLLAFAAIYGFCQDGGVYFGGRKYLAAWLGTTRTATAGDVLERLERKGLIEKAEIFENKIRTI